MAETTFPMTGNPQEPDPAPTPSDPEQTRRAMLAQSPEVRAEFAREVSIAVDGYRMGVAYIEGLIARARRSAAPGGLWLLGDGGVGKTFILKAIFKAHPPTETRERRWCPVLSPSFSARPSESEILLSLLLQLGQNPALVSRFDNRTLRDRSTRRGRPAAPWRSCSTRPSTSGCGPPPRGSATRRWGASWGTS